MIIDGNEFEFEREHNAETENDHNFEGGRPLSTMLYINLEQKLEETTEGNALEIGTFNGNGICKIADANPNRKFFSIDPFIEDGNTQRVPTGERLQKEEQMAVANFSKLSNAFLFRMTTKEFLGRYQEKIKDWNIFHVIIDGAHVAEFIDVDLLLCRELVLNAKDEISFVFDDFHIRDVKLAILKFEKFLKEEAIVLFEELSPYSFKVLRRQ